MPKLSRFSITPKIAAVLCGKSRIRYIKLVFQLSFFILSREFSNKTFKINFSFNNVIFPIFLKSLIDLEILREIYIEKGYEWFPVENPKVIIDLGAYFGDTTLYYHLLFPDALIIAVEPSPENFKRLKENTYQYKNIIAVQAALGKEDGEVTLNLTPNSLGHSILKRAESTKSVIVPQYTLQNLMTMYGITEVDLIKFDIEGAEFEMFSDVKPLSSVRALIGEVHLDLTNSSLETFLQPFADYNATVTEVTKNKRFVVRLEKIDTVAST